MTTPANMNAPLITPEDLAELFGAPRSKVMEWNRTYEWPHIRVGRRIRWTPEQVVEITRRHSVTSQGVVRNDGRTHRSAMRRRSA